MSSACPEGAEEAGIVASRPAPISFAALLLALAGAAWAPVAAPHAAQAQDRDRAGAPTLGEPGPDLGHCTVERIIDGDTFVCEGGERVRLILINAPEMSDSPLGELARDELVRILPLGTSVRLEGDVSERDRYGRILAYVHTPDGRMVNRLLARRGYAQVMVVPPDVRHVELIAAARDSARTGGAGLWDPSEGFGRGAPDGAVGGPSGDVRPPEDAPDRPEPGSSRDRGRSACHPSYPDVCIPPPPPDLNCGDIDERRFRVRGGDPHRFDGDGDGIGCESGE